jgi:integrase/recombinase XerD
MRDHELLGPWIRRFLIEHLIAERSLSIHTQHGYRDALRLLLPFVAAKISTPVDRLRVVDISPEQVCKFLAHIERDRRCSVATRNQRLAALHAFARFIGEHSPEHVEWCTQIRLIPYKRGTRPLISYLTEAEMQALLAAPRRETEHGYKDHVLLLFLYNSGARASEAASLRVQDVDAQGRLVHITGKGKKQRVCPLWPATIKHLKVLIAGRAPHEPLFRNRLKQPMTRFGVHTLVERHAARAAEQQPSMRSKRVSPHDSSFDGDAPAPGRCRYQHHSGVAWSCQRQHNKCLCGGRSGGESEGTRCLFSRWRSFPMEVGTGCNAISGNSMIGVSEGGRRRPQGAAGPDTGVGRRW